MYSLICDHYAWDYFKRLPKLVCYVHTQTIELVMLIGGVSRRFLQNHWNRLSAQTC